MTTIPKDQEKDFQEFLLNQKLRKEKVAQVLKDRDALVREKFMDTAEYKQADQRLREVATTKAAAKHGDSYNPSVIQRT